MSLASHKLVLEAKSQQMQTRSIDDVLAAGSFIIGSVDTVRRRIVEAHADLKLGWFLAMPQFGTLPHELAMKNIELLGTEVLPYVRERIPGRVPA